MNTIAQIITNTPKWVFVLFFILVLLGIMQMRTRQMAKRRIIILPVALLFVSLSGIINAFGQSIMPILAWALGYLVIAWYISNTAALDASYDAVSKKFTVAGSVQPLALMMAIFFMRYFVGASTAMQASFTKHELFSIVIGLLYGMLSGAFAGRAWRLLKLIH